MNPLKPPPASPSLSTEPAPTAAEAELDAELLTSFAAALANLLDEEED